MTLRQQTADVDANVNVDADAIVTIPTTTAATGGSAEIITDAAVLSGSSSCSLYSVMDVAMDAAVPGEMTILAAGLSYCSCSVEITICAANALMRQFFQHFHHTPISLGYLLLEDISAISF